MSLVRHFDIEKIDLKLDENSVNLQNDEFDISVLDGEIFMTLRWPQITKTSNLGTLKFDPFIDHLQFNVNDELEIEALVSSSIENDNFEINFRNEWLENGEQFLSFDFVKGLKYHLLLPRCRVRLVSRNDVKIDFCDKVILILI